MSTDPLLRPFDPLRAAIGDYLGALQSEGKSPKTLRNYGDVLKRFAAFAGRCAGSKSIRVGPWLEVHAADRLLPRLESRL